MECSVDQRPVRFAYLYQLAVTAIARRKSQYGTWRWSRAIEALIARWLELRSTTTPPTRRNGGCFKQPTRGPIPTFTKRWTSPAHFHRHQNLTAINKLRTVTVLPRRQSASHGLSLDRCADLGADSAQQLLQSAVSRHCIDVDPTDASRVLISRLTRSAFWIRRTRLFVCDSANCLTGFARIASLLQSAGVYFA